MSIFPTKLLRLTRVARLLKLTRLIKLSRVFNKIREIVQVHLLLLHPHIVHRFVLKVILYIYSS